MIIQLPQTGQCQCGYIQYRIIGQPLALYVCHCLHCQKQSSSAFGMSLWVARDEIEWLGGELKFWMTSGDSGYEKICAFCEQCGSRIYHGAGDQVTPLSIKAGTLDDISWLHPTCHIWTDRAQPWMQPLLGTQQTCGEEPDSDVSLMRQWMSGGG